MKISIFIVFSLFIPSGISTAQIITGALTDSPLAHCRSFYDMSIVNKLYLLKLDLNNDGIKEILISTVDEDSATQLEEISGDLGWLLYIGKPAGNYKLAGEKTSSGINDNSGVIFNKNQYWVGLIPELNRHGLLHLVCGRVAKQCANYMQL